MAIDVSQRIRNVYYNLSKGHKRIANIVLREPLKVEAYSCHRLANYANVSDSTVMRFVNTIGYEKYSDFRQAISDESKHQMNLSEHIVLATENAKGKNVAKQSIRMDIRNLNDIVDYLDPDIISKFVDATILSKRKFIIGFDNDEIMARLAYNYLLPIFDNVSLLLTSDDSFLHLYSLTKNDQVIIFASNATKRLMSIAKYAKSKNAIVSVITNQESNPITEFANHIVVSKSTGLSFNESVAGYSSVINALTVEIMKKDRERITIRHRLLNKLRKEYEK